MNPYITQQAGQLQTDATNNLQRRILPGINSGALAAGGFGGSRQGIAQGLAIGETNRGVADAQTNLYSNAYNTDQASQLQRDLTAQQLASQQSIAGMQNQTQRDLGFAGIDLGKTQAQNQFDVALGGLGLNELQARNALELGRGQLDLGRLQANQGFYTSQRGQDLQQVGLGANLTNLANLGLTQQGQQLYGVGQTEQQAPWNALNQFSSLLGPFSGLNQTSTQTTPGPSTAGSALGGALTAAQIYNMLFGGGKP